MIRLRLRLYTDDIMLAVAHGLLHLMCVSSLYTPDIETNMGVHARVIKACSAQLATWA